MSERSMRLGRGGGLNLNLDESDEKEQYITLNDFFENYELTFNQLAGIIFQFIEILDYLNSRQIRVNNLNPDNIIIQDDGMIAILDYSLTSKNYKYNDSVFGKPIHRISVDDSFIDTDLWSFGRVIQSYFVNIDDENRLYDDISIDCSKRLTLEECKYINQFLEVALHNENLNVTVEDLKSLPIYRYVRGNGGISFAMGQLVPSVRTRSVIPNSERLSLVKPKYKKQLSQQKFSQKFLQGNTRTFGKDYTRKNIRRARLERSKKRESPYNLELPSIREDEQDLIIRSPQIDNGPEIQLLPNLIYEENESKDAQRRISPPFMLNLENIHDEKETKQQQEIQKAVELNCSEKYDRTLLNINVKKLKLLGSGKFGSVYKYNDTMALKVIKISQFVASETLSCKLNNRHFVEVIKVAFNENEYRVLMSLIEGMTLDEMFKGELVFDAIALIVFQFIEILSYLDSVKMKHNDLKPNNIMMQPDGLLKVMDYSLLDEKYVSATEKYSASKFSENLEGIWTDAWSLALSLMTYFGYEAPPFKGIPCKSRNFSDEQCEMISEYLAVSLQTENPVTIDVLKKLRIYEYGESVMREFKLL